jgi:peptide deformylase
MDLNKLKLFTIENKEEKKFLSQKTKNFDFKMFNSKELTQLINKMKKIMRDSQGIGLSANQVGLSYRFFIAEVPTYEGNKFYAIFNPKIEKLEGKKLELEEGCLSVPGVYGKAPRYGKITISGFNRYGKPIKIKAWGLLAHVFQHEIDHLDGKLFIDKAKELYKIKNQKDVHSI